MPTKVCLVKAMVFLVVMYGCESWTVKKADTYMLTYTYTILIDTHTYTHTHIYIHIYIYTLTHIYICPCMSIHRSIDKIPELLLMTEKAMAPHSSTLA